MNLKEKILSNEFKNLLVISDSRYKIIIKQFIKKVEAFEKDGDIVKFVTSNSFKKNKLEFFNFIKSSKLKSVLDIVDKENIDDLEVTSLDDLKKGDLYSYMTISALAGNFNGQVGMYFNEKNNFIILKSEIDGRNYSNRWVEVNKEIIYYLQKENVQENFKKREFRKTPNLKIYETFIDKSKNTIHLFVRYNKGDRYFYSGECEIIEFIESNKAILLRIKQ